MNKKVKRGGKGKNVGRRRQGGAGLGAALRAASERAHDQANRRSERRAGRSMKAALAATAPEQEGVSWVLQGLRWLAGLLLLPFCWVTTWTFLAQVSDVTERENLWTTAAFWYFATGVLLMTGWFFTGLLRPLFLYLYVLGHELTHIVFIWFFRGKVKDWGVSLQGGHVTTNKSNIVIALAPYFMPFWSAVSLLLYWVLRMALDLPPTAEKALFFVVGFSWTFHLLWTLWMIPRDQPDLRENGTFLSLVIIFLVNLLVVVAMLCVVSEQMTWRGFGVTWAVHASEGIRWAAEWVGRGRELLVWLRLLPAA